MRYKVILEPGYLRVEVSGRERAGDAKKLLAMVNKVMFKVGKTPLMICSTEAAPLSPADLYVLARHVSETPLRHLRIALLYDVDDGVESSQSIEAIGQHRAMDMAAFRTLKEAAQWLADGQNSK